MKKSEFQGQPTFFLFANPGVSKYSPPKTANAVNRNTKRNMDSLQNYLERLSLRKTPGDKKLCIEQIAQQLGDINLDEDKDLYLLFREALLNPLHSIKSSISGVRRENKAMRWLANGSTEQDLTWNFLTPTTSDGLILNLPILKSTTLKVLKDGTTLYPANFREMLALSWELLSETFNVGELRDHSKLLRSPIINFRQLILEIADNIEPLTGISTGERYLTVSTMVGQACAIGSLRALILDFAYSLLHLPLVLKNKSALNILKHLFVTNKEMGIVVITNCSIINSHRLLKLARSDGKDDE